MNRFNTKGKRTYNISEIIVGDIVKFKGTRNGGIRKIFSITRGLNYDEEGNLGNDLIVKKFFSKVLNQKMSGFSEEPYTSTNNIDKLSHVFREGTWFKVIKE